MSYLAGRLRQSFTAALEQIRMSVLTDRFTKAEAAEYLGVSERSLDLWRAKDTGPRSFKIAGKVCWLKNDCDEWLAAQIVSTTRGGIR
jgi:predicted DNA-binding transcriptional regulator AlpA